MAFGKPSAERAAIETTYEDTANVSWTVKQTGADKITKRVPQVIYSEIICALSYTGSDKSAQTNAQNKIDYDAVVFMSPELLIRPGDKVTLRRFGRDNPNSEILLEFSVVGRPLLYETHQEVRVKDDDIE